jgi:AcrR family transcriptional regulator
VRKQELLDAAIEYVAGHGIAETSLREIAAAIGTSHRMLIHYFGSKEGLFVAIVQEVEQRQLQGFEPTWEFWKRVSDPALWPNIRLFFEVYGRALAGRADSTPVLDGIVESWLEPMVEQGIPRADARLGLAVARGLLLDLVATGDVDGVDAAMARWAELYSTTM